MSYYPNQQQGGYPPHQGGPPPPQGYGPPPNQYNQPPPPSHSPYPPQNQGWGQQNMQSQQYNQQYPPQQQWGQPPPPNQYGPPQGQQAYGAPLPGQYPPQHGYPPPQQYNQPPPNQYNAPPPGQPYGAAPQGYPPPHSPQPGYGAPPPVQQHYGAPSPGQQPYGAPPPQNYAPQPGYGAPAPGHMGGPSTPASWGYGPQQTIHKDVGPQLEAVYKAMKGWNTDEKALIKALSNQGPLEINTIREQFKVRYHADLVEKIKKETSGKFEDTLVEIIRGPLLADVWDLKDAVKGIGTKEVVLNDVLCNRSNADINAIKTEYQRVHGVSLESDLRSDLSGGTEQLFVMLVSAHRREDSAPVIPQEIDQDVTALQNAVGSMVSKNATQACQLLTTRNDTQIRALAHAYKQRYKKSLQDVLKSTFTGHMKDVLVLIVARAEDRALSDAIQLEDSMAGIGTKDTLLIQRVVRAHWDPQHMKRVRQAYKDKHGKDLVKRVKGETSGDYEDLLVALIEASGR